MKLLVITDSYGLGGLETHLITYFKYLKKSGFSIVLATRFTQERPYFKDLDLYVDRFHEITFDDYSSRSILALAGQVSEIIRTEDVDLIHIHPFLCIYAGFLAAVENNKPAILTLHGKLSVFSYDYPTAHFLNHVILPSLSVLTVNRNIFRAYDGKLDIHYLPNPIDGEFWKRSPDARTENYLLMVSRLSPDKSHSVEAALRKLHDIIEELGLGLAIKVAGAGSCDELLKEKHPGVEFLGHKDSRELRGLMENAVAVFGMGRVTLESLFLGKNSFIVNYDGDVAYIDEETFKEAEEFNFNGTSLQENITASLIKELAAGGGAVIPPDFLKRFSGSGIVSQYKKLADGLVKGFKGYCSGIKVASQVYRYHLASDAKASELDMAILERDNALNTLNSVTSERDGLRAEVRVKEEQISSLVNKGQVITRLTADKDSLVAQLDKIYKSDFWKAASFYYRIRNGLLRHPHRFLSTLRREGIGMAFRKTFGKLRDQTQPAEEKKANNTGEFNPYDYLRLLKDIEISVLDRDFSEKDVRSPFSFVTTIKNESRNITDFLKSIEAQSLRPDEVIIVDGGSSDSTAELVEEYKGTSALNIKFIRHEGANIACGRNIGVREAENELLLFGDAGCKLDKEFCLNLIGCLDAPLSADLAGGIYKPLRESDYSKYFVCDWEIAKWKDFLPSARALAVKKSLVMKIGGFPEYLSLTGEDTLFDVNYRRVSNKWVFNKRAVVYWEAPQTEEQAYKLAYSYATGDGQSAMGEFRYYRQLARYLKEGVVAEGSFINEALVKGFIKGRKERPGLEIDKRRIKGVFLLLLGGPLAGTDRLVVDTAMKMIAEGYKVVLVTAAPEPEILWLDIDYTMLELYSIHDFNPEDFIQRYRTFIDKIFVVAGGGRFRKVVDLLDSASPVPLKILDMDGFVLKGILEEHKKPIVVLPPLLDWDIPLLQRYQHTALGLGEKGFLYFFCTPNYKEDIKGFRKVGIACYVTDRYDLVSRIDGRNIVHFYSGDRNLKYADVQREIANGNIVLYEYIDEIHEAIIGEVPQHVFDRHREVLNNEECIVISTATKLHNEVLSHRSGNCALVTNGVEYEHFAQQFKVGDAPKELVPLINKGKPIIGYFGAFAKWFDFELIERLARERPQYELLLIGWNYDGSLDKYDFAKCGNVTILDPVKYNDLPRYAYWFSVSTIPFRINEVTESTSPIKLFEYMALGRPIVVTDLPECRKYKSVLIGKDHGEFIEKVDSALALKDDSAYRETLKAEAQGNTWGAKAATIAEMLRGKYFSGEPLPETSNDGDVHEDNEWIRFARAQASFFYNLAMENLPEWLAADIDENALSILDFGCSMGDGVDILARGFHRSRLAGIDTEEWRIDRAKERYPHGNFIAADIRDIDEKFDCIFSSNTLEHFERPFDAVKELLVGRANKHMIFLVPFQEYERIEGHYFTFDSGNVPSIIDSFRLAYMKEIDCMDHPGNHYQGEQVHWSGKQALLVYVKENGMDVSGKS